MVDFNLSSAALAGEAMFEAAIMVFVFVLVLFAGSMVLPGRTGSGPDIEGKQQVYKLNGLTLFLSVVVLCCLAQVFGLFSLSTIHDRFAALFVVANGFAFVLAALLYLSGRRARGAVPGTGRGFFLGLDHTPNWLGVDLKLFSYRPSLVALALINASFAVVQYEKYGELTLAMAVYQLLTFLYLFNYFQFEYGMTYTWDMISERFGWLLIWGDYVLVPFFYCLPGWWLIHSPDSLSTAGATAIILLFLFGGWIFRGANEQKHRFKLDSKAMIWGKPAESLEGRLLVSGFWGVGRHLNYTGEILIYFAFTFTTGFGSWVPYLLPVWLVVLLWHRSRRDDRRCRAKYGRLWELYTQRVRYILIPFIY